MHICNYKRGFFRLSCIIRGWIVLHWSSVELTGGEHLKEASEQEELNTGPIDEGLDAPRRVTGVALHSKAEDSGV
jgi:hypothetical protein